MSSEVSVSDIGRRDSRGVEKDIRATLQLEGDSNHRGSDSIWSCSSVFGGAPQDVPIKGDEGIKREECGYADEAVSGVAEEVLGDAYVGEGIFCEYEWSGWANDTGIYTQAGGRRVSGRAIKAMEGVNEDEVRPIKATDKVGGSLLTFPDY